MKRNKYGYLLILTAIILIATFFFLIYYFESVYFDNKKNKEILFAVEKHKSIEFFSTINPDIIGWIKIDKTDIDYPLLQSNNNDFYLNHNYLKEKNISGSIFLDYRNNPELQDQNSIIYGHHMIRGMFHDLKYFKNYDYLKNFIYIKTGNIKYKYEVFAVISTNNPYQYIPFPSDNFNDYISKLQKNSLVHANISVKETDKIITLFTCDYFTKNGKLLVFAKCL